MKVLEPGHRYELAPLEAKPMTKWPQTLEFVRKEEINGQFVTIHNGTTNEDVLEVLINRIQYLNAKMPSKYNDEALLHLERALAALRERTLDRTIRGVENSPNP